MAMSPASTWKPLVLAALAAFGVAAIGGTLTDLGPWYQSLDKPAWQPPGVVFPLAWTLIFALAVLSATRAWVDAPGSTERSWVVGLFLFNGFLNVLWSLLFFWLKRPDWALIEVGFLWMSVFVLMLYVGRYSRPAGWLLVPYLIWVGIAAYLTLTIVRLNGPF